MNSETQIKAINDNAEAILEPDNRTVRHPNAGKPGYVCPACGSGTHSRLGTGMTKYKGKDGKERLKCHACGWSGDVLDYIGTKYGIDTVPEQLAKAGELGLISKEPEKRTANTATTKSAEQSYAAYYDTLETGCDYLSRRGISLETQSRLGILYDRKKGAVVFPTSEKSYNSRKVYDSEGAKCLAAGHRQLFNAGAMDNDIVFAVEGEIDAASIEECGMPAVGLGGVGMVGLLTEYATALQRKPAIIIAMDNDDAGRKAADKLAQELRDKGYPFFEVAELYGTVKDANDALLADRDAFTASLKESADGIRRKMEYAEESERISFDAMRQSNRQHILEEYVWKKRGQTAISTGFAKIDSALNGGLRDGLVVLMAAPSVGKTTLSMQMAHNIAEKGNDVIFVSYEDDEPMLQSKIRSMYTAEFELEDHKSIGRYCLMQTEIADLNAYPGFNAETCEILAKAEHKQKQVGEHIIIMPGTVTTTVEDIEKIALDCIRINAKRGVTKKPVLIVDYLQKIKNTKVKDIRERINDSVGRLREIAAGEEMTVIAICSTSRANYNGERGMAGGKESGDIEYDAKVVLDLNYFRQRGLNEDEMAQLQPRRLILRVLKNKDGQKGDAVCLNYYSRFNYFMEASEEDVRFWKNIGEDI